MIGMQRIFTLQTMYW